MGKLIPWENIDWQSYDKQSDTETKVIERIDLVNFWLPIISDKHNRKSRILRLMKSKDPEIARQSRSIWVHLYGENPSDEEKDNKSNQLVTMKRPRKGR